jgi:Tol biopolymer transport system component
MPRPVSRLGASVCRAGAMAVCLALAAPASAQYFGQNKVQYEKFDFRVLKTEHFDIHYYPEEADAAKEVGRMAERWHARLTRLLHHELSGRQPIILYASHPHFEQTNVVEGFIGEGTGGVTEGAKRRVTLPLAATMAETDHVLGHELVHAFQYDILGMNGEALPLWFIEGMAEYLSIGPRDVQTAMWLRDAALNETLPAIKDLDHPKYFPYRFGHAFWAYLGGRWGDDVTGKILNTIAEQSADGGRGSGRGGFLETIEIVTGQKITDLSDQWQNAIRTDFGKLGGPTDPNAGVERVFGSTKKGSGEMNVGPAISPDGTRIAFLSSRERLSINLYLADASTGKIERKLLETAADPHFDSLQFLASAGAWDPTGHSLAIGAIRNGRPLLAIIDADRGGVKDEIPFKDLGEIFQPAWSPDGKSIAFSAQVGGHTDLFVHNLASHQTTRLTNDVFGDLQPAWSPDGKEIAFVTDRFSTDLAKLSYRGYGLAIIGVGDQQIRPLDTGLTGTSINPQWSADGSKMFFIADAGGRQNVWQMDMRSRRSTRVTDEATGVAGITPLSPGLSISADGSRAGVSVFRDSGYDVHVIRTAASAAAASVAAPSGDAALLPPAARPASAVAEFMNQPALGLPPVNATTTTDEEYKAGLQLLGIGQQVGVTAGGRFGTYVGGGISMTFSDTLGNHLLGTTFQVNGGVRDIGAQAVYLNRTSRWNLGIFGERLPFISGTADEFLTVQNGQLIVVDQVLRFRETDNQLGVMTAYPISRATRVEFSAAARHIGFVQELQTDTFDYYTGQQLTHDVTDLGAASSLNLGQTAAAIVRDTSVFGATSPLRGTRMRVEAAPTFGGLRMVDMTADYRRYVMPVRPITFAGRVMHIARYGTGGEDSRLFPLFLGYPDLVRGYGSGSFRADECGLDPSGACPAFDRLFGSRLLVANAEVRAPLVGLFNRSLSYGPVPIEVFAFADAGMAWTRTDKPSFAGGSRDWITSVGGGARVNVFGFAIAEFNLAKPINRPTRGWLFVFNLRPGF